MKKLPLNLVGSGLIALTACGLAQVAPGAPVLETLFQQNDLLDGASDLPGFATSDLVRLRGSSEVIATPNGSFVTTVRTNPFEGSANSAAGVYYLFGSTDRGDSPVALRREALLSGIDQQSLGSATIDHAGSVTYRALTGNTGTAGSGDSGLWENDTPYAYPGDAIQSGPLAGSFFQSLSNAYRSPSGVTSWTSSYSDTAIGASVGSALMQDTTANNVLLQSGDTIAGLGTIISESGAIGNLGRSLGGGSYIAEIDLEPGFTSTDEAPIVNGAALYTPSGALIREGAVIPVVDGGLELPDGMGGTVGETWDLFGLTDVNETGDWIASIFTDAESPRDSLITVNGTVIHREGDTLDSIPLAGQVQGVAINDLGDIAFVWNDTLFVNDQAIAGATTIDDLDGNSMPGLGTLVDTTGDGVGDSPINGNGYALGQLEITNLPAAGGDGLPIVYASATVGAKTSVFRFAAPEPLAGDYNADGVVDAADYTVWRDTDGSSLLLAADGDEDNQIGAGDLTVWSNNYGATLPGPSNAVPEPAACLLVFFAALGATAKGHQRHHASRR